MKRQKVVQNRAQQGDVVIEKVGDKLPEGAKVISRKRCVLAEGEATGHAHVVEADDATLVKEGDRILLHLGSEGTVVHEEHKPITLAPGVYEIGRVQEYDYFSKMSRPVAD